MGAPLPFTGGRQNPAYSTPDPTLKLPALTHFTREFIA